MKRFVPVVLTLICVMLLLTLCGQRNKFTLSQPYDNVSSVEIVYVADDNILVKGFLDSIQSVCTVNVGQWHAFFDDFYSITCSQYLNDPAESVTGEVIRVTYKDGAFDLIGRYSIFYCTSEKSWDYLPYYFDYDAFNAFINVWKNQQGQEDESVAPTDES